MPWFRGWSWVPACLLWNIKIRGQGNNKMFQRHLSRYLQCTQLVETMSLLFCIGCLLGSASICILFQTQINRKNTNPTQTFAKYPQSCVLSAFATPVSQQPLLIHTTQAALHVFKTQDDFTCSTILYSPTRHFFSGFNMFAFYLGTALST